MRNKWSTTLPGAGYKVYIYTLKDRGAAKIYTSKDSLTAIQTIPQIVSPSSGAVEFWVDTLDYDLDQIFDIDIYDPVGKYWTSIKDASIFKVRDYLANRGASVVNMTWDNDVTVKSGQCMTVILPEGHEIDVPDGINFTVEDGGIFLLDTVKSTFPNSNLTRWF